MSTGKLWRRFGPDLAAHGFIESRRGRSVVTLARDPGAIQAIGEFLRLVRQRYPRNHMVFFAKDAGERRQLEERFPGDRILGHPTSSGYAHGRVICNLRTQLLMIVGIPDTDLARWIDQALRAGTSIVMVESADAALWRETVLGRLRPEWLQKITLFVMKDSATARALEAAGVKPDRMHMHDPAAGSPQQHADQLIDRLVPALSAKKRPRKYWNILSRFSITAINKLIPENAFGQWLVARQYSFIDNLPALADYLGHPKTIMCLGNGPSSEAPELGTTAHDSLFRVNHRWQDRGLLTEPDMVFTGKKITIAAVGPKVLYGILNVAAKQRLAFQCLTLRKRLLFTVAESLGIIDMTDFSGFRPTNGAIMLATAVALAPERLIIAGIDLFSHPDGSYPGDDGTPNAYTIGHDRNTELHFILETLDRYDGELIIHGEVLADHWQRHKTNLDHQTLPQSA
ncbi:MAG: hypothetical protein ACR2QJ_16755 [Geminicoccaceae bacterium]